MLNPKYISAANAQSHFNAGDSINGDAIRAVARFDEHFSVEGLTQEQTAYLAERRESWRQFALDHYNDQCRRRADYVPVSVCGPSRYPGKQMEKRVDKIMSLQGEFAEKAKRFFDNTQKALDAMTPLEDTLAQLRAGEGKWETIRSDDPHAMEKLKAKLAGFKEKQEAMKAVNKAIRGGKTEEERLAALCGIGYSEAQARGILKPDCMGEIGFASYSLQNNNANIKRLESRIAVMKREAAAPTLHGWKFNGGEVVANRELDRLQILFDARPDSDMIAKLKKAAFKWSPRNVAWQRQLTANAVYAAQRLLEAA